MNITVIVWRITTSYNAPFDADGFVVGNFIHAILDDSDDSLHVEVRDSSVAGSGTLVSTPVTGPGLFFVDGGISTRLTPDPLYRRCDGVDLYGVIPINTFPYASFGVVQYNAAECQIAPVCDIQLSDDYTVVEASGPGTPDGSLEVSATSSNGVIRYSLQEGFTYGDGQLSGLFSALVPGEYTVYSMDEIGCTDQIIITIPITEVYGVKYRIEYDDIRGGASRVDILERAYAGAIAEINETAANPFVLRYNKDVNNKYDEIAFSEGTIQLLTTTPEQFIELFQGDDRQFKVIFYKEEASVFNLKWVGFVVPEYYSEPYMTEPFYTTISCSDNLKVVSEFDFYDENGNQIRDSQNIIRLLSRLLVQTGLKLNIRCAVDLIEAGMDDTEDPLAQSFIDPTIFYDVRKEPDKIEEVIRKQLFPYGARIFQADGVWWIIRIEQSVGTFDYREFDYQGDFIEDGNFASPVDLTRDEFLTSTCWKDNNQLMQLMRHYGEIEINHNLALDNNLLDSGSFEREFLTHTGGGSFFFEGWNVFQADPGLRYGLEQVENGDSEGAFYMDFDNVFTNTNDDNILYTKKVEVDNSSSLTIKFQYLIDPTYQLPFVRLGYRVKVVSLDETQTLYLFHAGVSGGLTDDTAGIDDWNDSGYINEIYATEFGKFVDKEFSFLVPFHSSGGWTLEFSLFINNNSDIIDADNDFAELKAVSTSTRLWTIRRKYLVQIPTVNGITYDYMLEASDGTESESLPDIVEPNDWHATNNPSRWKRKNTLLLTYPEKINKVLIDNFSISEKVLISDGGFFGKITPPSTVEYKAVLNAYNFNKLPVTSYLGDLPESDDVLSDVQNAELIYDGFIRLEDGTPTNSWRRISEDGEQFLLEILLEDYVAQMRTPARKITGNILSPTFLSFANSINHVFEGRRYMFNSYEFNDRKCDYSVDLVEVVTGLDGDPPPSTFEFTEEFSTEFDA